MNKFIFKNYSGISFRINSIFCAGLMLCIGNTNALEVSINGSENLVLAGDIVFDYELNPHTIGFQVDSPFLCTSIDTSSEQLLLEVNDANNIPISTDDDGVLSVVYDFQNSLVKITTDNSVQCASKNGVNREILNSHGFELAKNDLQISLLDENGSPFAETVIVTNQQIFNYQYVVENNGNIALATDVGEFYKVDLLNPYFSGVPGDDWACAVVDAGNGSTSTCGDFGNGDFLVQLKNAILEPGEQLVISVSRLVELPNVNTGTSIELLATVFTTVMTDTIITNNYIFKLFSTPVD